MSYTALSFTCPGSDADAWGDALLGTGALAVESTDAQAGTAQEVAQFAEPGLPGFVAWPVARVTALFAAEIDAGAALAEAAGALGRATPAATSATLEEQDWVRATQAQFGPIRIAEDFHVVPTWCEPPPPGTAIRLDPGLAFGTGSHPTTRLCLEWLHATLPRGASVLDYGCGSGILAIAAAKLGAGEVAGTDVDAQALAASRANAAANAVRASFARPEGLRPGPFDVVVANILANPLVLLAPAIAARVAREGRLALSGILADQAAEVIAAYAPWITLRAWRTGEGWVLLAGARGLA
ncbi:MAG: 50S ribosomal protein L11 methyltransferase [Betaproteobacteria bacterium]|jgi:ribosomal protein L11 methyltransferase|nr:50S ribosomal protein L11 methyltransferase [Betaproteobacteria bacterium]